MSTSLALLTSTQLMAPVPGEPARRHSRKNSAPNRSAKATNAIANDRKKSLRMTPASVTRPGASVSVRQRQPASGRIVLQEREVALRQVIELESTAAARALERGRLEGRGEDRGGLDQPLLLVIAADAVERREERGHGAAADHVANHRGLQDERHRAGVELVALDPRLAQELAPRAHAERVHVRDLRGVEHDAADHRGQEVVEPGRLGEVAAQHHADALAVLDDLPVPVQPPPDQPVNVEVAAAAAVSVTAWLKLKSAAQVAPQLIPAGLDVTVPAPLPARATVSANRCSVNVAVTVVAAVIVVVHAAVPVQPPPDQPVNVEPVAGVAVSVTA